MMGKVFTAILFYSALMILGWTLRGYFIPQAEQHSRRGVVSPSCSPSCVPYTELDGSPPPAVVESIQPAVTAVCDTWLTRRLCSLLVVSCFLVVFTFNVGYDFLHEDEY